MFCPGLWISHRYELCALPSFLLSILMPFTSPFSPDHIIAMMGDPLGPCLRKEEAANMEEHEAGSNCRSGGTEIPSSRAQGFKIRLVMEKGTRPSTLKHSATETLESAVQYREYRFCRCFHECCFLFFVDLLYIECRHMSGYDFAFGLIVMSFIWSFIYSPFRS